MKNLKHLPTSIGFGGGEVIEVDLPLEKVQELLQGALVSGVWLELNDLDGERIIVNPQQVKVLQKND